MKQPKRAGIALAAILAAVLMAGCATTAKVDPQLTAAGVGFRMAMRDLWNDHTLWTRMYIVSAVAGTPDAPQAADRLMKNQDDIGNAIKPYYGEEAGAMLTRLLREHISIAGAVVAAAKAGDKVKLPAAQAEWTANADSIAAFLAGANPNWTRSALTDMLHEHLKVTTEEAVARITKDYAADVAAYEAIHKQAMMMADELAAGIIRQFPDKFTAN